MKQLALLLISALSFVVQAQPVKSATSEELIEKLAVPFANTRSLTARNLEPQPRSLDLVIQFEFDSAKLKSESKPLLDNLSTALKSDRLKSIQFKVEGHTDAKGTEAYNQALSLKRANAVVDYMTQQGIEADRLKAEGKGFAELLVPEKPLAMENRRVRISTIQ
jgi:outer membrane protein OmpA-like peptidoglycan-associated protein